MIQTPGSDNIAACGALGLFVCLLPPGCVISRCTTCVCVRFFEDAIHIWFCIGARQTHIFYSILDVHLALSLFDFVCAPCNVVDTVHDDICGPCRPDDRLRRVVRPGAQVLVHVADDLHGGVLFRCVAMTTAWNLCFLRVLWRPKVLLISQKFCSCTWCIQR